MLHVLRDEERREAVKARGILGQLPEIGFGMSCSGQKSRQPCDSKAFAQYRGQIHFVETTAAGAPNSSPTLERTWQIISAAHAAAFPTRGAKAASKACPSCVQRLLRRARRLPNDSIDPLEPVPAKAAVGLGACRGSSGIAQGRSTVPACAVHTTKN